MERQGVQVKKLEANHAHLINRNNFRVLIFQVRVTFSEVRGTYSPCWSILKSWFRSRTLEWTIWTDALTESVQIRSKTVCRVDPVQTGSVRETFVLCVLVVFSV